MDCMGKGFFLGIDNSGDKCEEDEFFNAEAISAIGARFVVKHYRPRHSVADEARLARLFARKAEENGVWFILNTEIGNWAETLVSPDGWDWVSCEDGGHRRFPLKYLRHLPQAKPSRVSCMTRRNTLRCSAISIGLEGGTANLSFFPDKPG